MRYGQICADCAKLSSAALHYCPRSHAPPARPVVGTPTAPARAAPRRDELRDSGGFGCAPGRPDDTSRAT
jgi:hypothetical protein